MRAYIDHDPWPQAEDGKNEGGQGCEEKKEKLISVTKSYVTLCTPRIAENAKMKCVIKRKWKSHCASLKKM